MYMLLGCIPHSNTNIHTALAYPSIFQWSGQKVGVVDEVDVAIILVCYIEENKN